MRLTVGSFVFFSVRNYTAISGFPNPFVDSRLPVSDVSGVSVHQHPETNTARGRPRWCLLRRLPRGALGHLGTWQKMGTPRVLKNQVMSLKLLI